MPEPYSNSSQLSVTRTYEIDPFLGRFRSKTVESEFRQYSRDEDLKRARIIISIVIICSLWFGAMNCWAAGSNSVRFTVVSARLALILLSLWCLRALGRKGEALRLDRLLFFWSMGLVLSSMGVTAIATLGATPAALSDFMIILCLYLLVPMPLLYAATAAALVTLGSPSLWHAASPLQGFVLACYHLICHLGGGLFKVILSKSRRFQYSLLMRDRLLSRDLADSEERFRRLVEDIREDYYLFSHDPTGVFTYLSPSSESLFLIPMEEAIGKNWRQVFSLSPEMTAMTEKEDAKCLKGIPSEGQVFIFEHPEKGTKIFEVCKRPVHGEDGRVIAIEGIARDMTEETRIKAALEDSERRYRQVMENIDQAVVVIQDNCLVFVNHDVLQSTGRSKADLLDEADPFFYVSEDDKPKVRQNQARLLARQEKRVVDVIRTTDPDAKKQWAEYTSIFIQWEGRPATLNIIKNISRMKNLENELVFLNERLNEQNKELIRSAEKDPLTGIHNRRALTAFMEEHWSRSVRNGTDCSVVLMDIDFFKQVNDTHGHLAGDRLLKGVVSLLLQANRDYDRIGRWGGEEFLLFLPDTDLSEAALVAERMRIKVEEASFDLGDNTGLSITVSLGVASRGSTQTLSLEKLVACADHALYKAKETGRNKVCRYDPPLADGDGE